MRMPSRSAVAIALGGLAALGTAGAARAQAAGGGGVTVRVLRAPPADTNPARRRGADDREAVLARFDSLRRELETRGRNEPEYAALIHQLRGVLEQLSAESAMLRARIEVGERESPIAAAMARSAASAGSGLGMLRARAPLPPGFIGLNVEAPYHLEVRGDSTFIRYFAHPEIVSVEPNSPAERAGIVRGDMLAAYDGRDLREREVNLTRLLMPNNRVTVTVEREGAPRDFLVRVAEAPRSFMVRRVLTMRDSAEPSRVIAGRLAPTAPERTPSPPMARGNAYVFAQTFDAATAPVAGATMVAIEDVELGHLFGVTGGVLVTGVIGGPARRAGLAGGDVIVEAGGVKVGSVTALRRVLEAHRGDREVPLKIVRERRQVAITLRW